jgi:hypothetical protein
VKSRPQRCVIDKPLERVYSRHVKIGRMQKLVTIYLDSAAYAKGRMIVGSFADKHGFVEEHLRQDLSEGWRVISVSGFGGDGQGLGAKGWLVVLLEKSGG